MKNKKYTKEQLEELKVEWIGIDGALVILFIFLACFFGYGMLNKVDWIIGIMAPGIASGITIFAFIKYIFEVFTFAKTHVEDIGIKDEENEDNINTNN